MSNIVANSLIHQINMEISEIGFGADNANDFYLDQGLLWKDTGENKLDKNELLYIMMEDRWPIPVRIRVSKNNTLEFGY